ncbi:hypothetical protein OE88DRAFT_1634849, partial [Heliocybe sulcata]
MLGGNLREQEKARKLLTQIVNSLSVKMEIGAPMASAYILGNPDHYTSHRFKSVYWKSYVSEVLTSWHSDELVELSTNTKVNPKDQVLVRRTRDGYTMYSPVMDYTHRSHKYETICLYDWFRLSRKLPLSKVNNSNKTEDIKIDRKQDIKGLVFTAGHPQQSSHYATLVSETFALVPNFIGGNLPRQDSGSREFYCITMLTLFKSWRKGTDLKKFNESWDEAFSNFRFSTRQTQLMSNFNIRYECYDAHDDYSKQIK